MLLLSVARSFGQCPVYSMRAGTSLYFCGSSSVSATVAMGGSSVGYTYQLIRNGNSTIGDLVPGDGASTMKWTVYQPGTYTVIEYGGTCGGGTQMSGSTVITDLGTPPAIRINSENSNYRCIGQSISFTAQNGSGYSWYNNGQQVGTGSTYTPATSQAGTYVIKVQGTNACGVSQNDQVTLFVGPYPTASILAQGATTFCQNGNVILQTQSNGDTFQWFKDGQALSGYTSTTCSATLQGNYAFKASFGGGVCVTESAPVAVTVLTLPTVTISPSGNIPILFGDANVILSASTGSNYTYQWYNNGDPVNGEINSTFTATEAGAFTVKITDNNGCSDNSSATTITLENNYNYVYSQTIQIASNTDGSAVDESDLLNLNENQKQESVIYFDGLGRPMQSVTIKGSPSPSVTDIVQPIAYDAYGREQFKYLPYSSTEVNGLYKTDALTAQNQFYQTATNVAHDTNPYSETVFEPSPLNRVIEQGSPGSSWQPDADNSYTSTDHTIKHDYAFNGANEVILFTYDATTASIDAGSTTVNYYAANQLQANKTKDEQGNEVIEYVDKENHTVCKKVQYGTDALSNKLYASTYYIFDDFGSLVIVLPPEGVKAMVPSAN
ncbi:MAG TPA: DUF6443 domain-containing protein [Cyclobacteriaceae bacterium]